MSLLKDSIILCKRELLIFKANLRTNLMRIAMFPLVMLIFFSFLGSAVTNAPVVVVNYANNVQSGQLISALSSKSLMDVQSISTQQQALAMLSAGQVNFVIVILPNFPSRQGSPSVQVYYNNVQYSVTATLLPAIQQLVLEFSSPGNFQSSQYLPSSSPAAAYVATPVTGATGNYDDFLFAGVIGMVITFSALFGSGLSIIQDKLGGNIKAFLITPINKSAILLGRVFSGAIQSILSIAVVILIGMALGSTIAMGVVGLFWIFVIGILLAVCMTSVSAAIAARMKNLQAYTIFGQAIGMPLWFLSGGIFPVSSFPPILQAVSVVDPMTYALNGFRFVILQGMYPLASAAVDIAVLAVFGVIMTIISILLFKSTID